MRSRSVAVAALFTVLSVATAIGASIRASHLQSEAEWLQARGNAEAAEYATSFNPVHQDRQFATFAERAALMRGRMWHWQVMRMLAILGIAVGVIATYVLYLFQRLREQLIEGAPDLADTGQRG